MGKVQFITPKNRLTDQLKEPGGKIVAESIEAADDNLWELRPRAYVELKQAAAEVRECFQRFPKDYSHDALQELYGVASRAVGVGALCDAPAADTAFKSLCALLDHLMNRQRLELEPIAVHVQTLQLIAVGVQNHMDSQSLDQILLGLRKVSARFAIQGA